MKNLIDKRIAVLRPDFDEANFNPNEEGSAEFDSDSQKEGYGGDGTQVRTYINSVEIKVLAAEVMEVD